VQAYAGQFVCSSKAAGNGMPVHRRQLLIGSLGGLAGLACGRASATLVPEASTLSFYHLHTTEKLKITYRERGEVLADALAEINYFLRDHRSGQAHQIDVALLDTLADLYEQFGRRGHFEVISGYRSPATNEALRNATTGVAKDSLHVHGRAIDVRLTSAATAKLRAAAIALQRGGVGYYPESNFVHLDTGRFRTW
jgi:uncharacterized protein YcbK (DUF882 family)